MKVELIKATRGIIGSKNGLITFQVEIPLYIWVELLTHRRFARNASSARAMSTDRYLSMGYYTPDTFYKASKGMKASNDPVPLQWLARLLWRQAFASATLYTKLLERLGVAKEQRNRLIPPTKNIKGLVTGTEDAWRHFLALRNSPEADKAMQVLALLIAGHITYLNERKTWTYADEHIPFDPGEGSTEHRYLTAAARISRISYDRVEGKDDIASAKSLIKHNHMSPFEHIAVFGRDPGLSALFCKPQDSMVNGITIPTGKYGWLLGWGWKSYRTILENTQNS